MSTLGRDKGLGGWEHLGDVGGIMDGAFSGNLLNDCQ